MTCHQRRSLALAILSTTMWSLAGLQAQSPAPKPAPAPSGANSTATQKLGAATNTASASASAKATLTPELMAKIFKLISVYGLDNQLPAGLANPLGLGAAGKTWPYRVAIGSERDNLQHVLATHGFAVGDGNDIEMVLSVLRNEVVLGFRAHQDGTLVSALRYDKKTQVLTMRTPAEAQADFAAECAFWSANVDSLLKP